MKSVKDSVVTMYSSMTNKVIPAKLCQYWTSSIEKGAKTFDDFENFIISNSGYKQQILERYKNKFYMLIGFEFNIETFDQFWEGYKGGIVTDQHIHDHLCTLPEFNKKYEEIVIKIFRALSGFTQCSNDIICLFVDKFRKNSEYTIEKLQNDLEEYLDQYVAHDQNKEQNEEQDQNQDKYQDQNQDKYQDKQQDQNQYQDKQQCKEQTDDAKTIETIETIAPNNPFLSECKRFEQHLNEDEKQLFIKLCQDPKELIKVFHQESLHVKKYDLDIHFINAFEQHLKRPMFVHEYYKYKNEFDTINNTNDIVTRIKTHNMNFTRYKMLIHDYTGRDVSEYEYVRTCLDAADREDFFVKLVASIIDSLEYESVMKKHMSDRYLDMYGLAMDEFDLDYVFDHVKQSKMSLKDDNVRNVLVSFKDETDDIISRTMGTFMKVLERQPDESEIDNYIRFYRTNAKVGKSFQDVDIMVQRDLIISLEYHDILKKLIRAVYAKTHGTEIPPSILFKTLSDILNNLKNLELSDVIPFIEKLVA